MDDRDVGSEITIAALDASTWPAFADLVERNGGVFGGCWCVGFHPEGGEKGVWCSSSSP